MKKLSIDFAFEGFRMVRDKPWLLPVWGLAIVGLSIVFMIIMVAMSVGMAATMHSVQSGDLAPGQMILKFLPLYLVMTLVSLLFMAILSCAVYRCVLEGGKPGFGYLRLGDAEFRQILVYFLLFLLVLVVCLGVFVIGAIFMFILGMLFGVVSKVLAGVGLVVGGLAAFVGFFWIMTRMSLVSVQCFAERKFNIFGSWELTAGYSWTLFFGYFINLVIYIVISLGSFGIILLAENGSDVFRVSTVAVFFLGSLFVVWPFYLALFLGAPAAAYKALADVHDNRAENVF